MKATMPVTVEVPEHYVQLDEQGARNYYRARQRKALLDREVIKPFEAALRGFTDYSDENIPDETTEMGCDLGDIRFTMKCVPTTKRPSYEAVFSDLRWYVEDASKARPDGVTIWRPRGVKVNYVPVSALRERIERKQEEVESEGVKIDIATQSAPESVLGDAKAIPVPLNGSVVTLNEGNARLYLGAQELLELYKAIVTDFENALVGLTGYGNKNIPEETMHHWESLGRHLFHVPSIPYPSTSYGKVMARLARESEREIPSPEDLDKAGDLYVLDFLSPKTIRIPGAMGLNLHKRLKQYDVRERRSGFVGKFVSTKGMLKRMDKLKDEETKQKVRQKPIDHYPLV